VEKKKAAEAFFLCCQSKNTARAIAVAMYVSRVRQAPQIIIDAKNVRRDFSKSRDAAKRVVPNISDVDRLRDTQMPGKVSINRGEDDTSF
jgi:hypothetical protein